MFIQEAHQQTNHLARKLFSHFYALVKAEGLSDTLDIEACVAQVGGGINPADVDQSLITLNQYYQLLELSAPTLADTDFYLKLGQLFDVSDAGVLGYASLSVENLRQSWKITSSNYSLFPHPLTAEQSSNNNYVTFQLQKSARPSVYAIYLQEEWLSSTWKWMRLRLPQLIDVEALTIKLAYPAPSYAPYYNEIFPGKVLFAQQETEMIFPEAWYDMRFTTANQATADLCQQQCSLILAQLDKQSDLVDQVRRLLLLTPQREFPSLENIAQQLQLPVHTFHRELKKSNLSYRHIVNEVRMELAKDYLDKTKIPLQEISYILGYEHAANFYRAFKNWHGYTPTDYRQQKHQVLTL
ncbi:transcriptional regulator, AraC family [Colwellia chukchiensis]|uniref:Transcriptional regulator, AraC family n=1 Tax=Colwellia chukchiensis TaxID=641665 RepID=A0A1H7G817_9GAMM|nr:AraC family transcriptional regulator [Colwellia chukchiensis]SEK34289.1 transcriptional regulator, AraC family [Colwellia chukchiensis]